MRAGRRGLTWVRVSEDVNGRQPIDPDRRRGGRAESTRAAAAAAAEPACLSTLSSTAT